jgi:dolichol-phosphate mannosyltransferase
MTDHRFSSTGAEAYARVETDSATTSQFSGPTLTVVIPTLNEQPNIEPLIAKLRDALTGIAWEVIFVDDDSQDGTMDVIREFGVRDRRIRGMKRISRRGLAGACIEGILASSAPIVAVMDADLQHDETRLAEMYQIIGRDDADLVVASRYADADGSARGLTRVRQTGSRLAGWIARTALKVDLSDPMSGFFMIRREIAENVAPRLSKQGFKVLLDIVASSGLPIRTKEISYVFSPRLHGESKLDGPVVLEYLGLIISKASGDLISIRFVAFCAVGALGVVINLLLLRMFLVNGLSFALSETLSMFSTMVFNYTLNNALTYRDRRRRGWRFLTGLAMFAALCSLGVVAGVGVSSMFYEREPRWWTAGLAGAAVGAVWNYITNSAITWRNR